MNARPMPRNTQPSGRRFPRGALVSISLEILMSTLIHSVKTACEGEGTAFEIALAAFAVAALAGNARYFFA